MDDVSRGRPVVMVVDDDEDILEVMAYMLRRRGLQVVTAPDQETAMATLHELGGRVDALIADLSLGDDDPGGLTSRVTAAYPHIRIVYSSGTPRHLAISAGLVGPDDPYLEKPVNADVVAGVLQATLGGSPPGR